MEIEVEIKSNVDNVKKDFNDSCLKALNEIGLKIATAAFAMAPHDTGYLRNSITYAISGKNAAKTEYSDDAHKKKGSYSGAAPDDELCVYVGTNVEYAEIMELGSSRTKARPYLKPALTNNIGEIERIIRSSMDSM